MINNKINILDELKLFKVADYFDKKLNERIAQLTNQQSVPSSTQEIRLKNLENYINYILKEIQKIKTNVNTINSKNPLVENFVLNQDDKLFRNRKQIPSGYSQYNKTTNQPNNIDQEISNENIPEVPGFNKI